jgi:SAM-dependent methyltransferase
MNKQKIRAASFNKYFDVDKELMNIVGDNPKYSYLLNPAASNVYQYLTDYVGVMSENILHDDRSNISVLDWGAGKGNVTYLLRKTGFENILSCDIEEGKDSFLGSRPIIEKCELQIISLQHPWLLPFESESFDVVLSYGVLEHVPSDLESLREINRILKPGGLLFCFHLPRKFGYIHFIARQLGDLYHDRFYTRKSCASLLGHTKFRILDIWERSLFPKNRLKFFDPRLMERLDNFLVGYTPLRLISTNIEFVAQKEVSISGAEMGFKSSKEKLAPCVDQHSVVKKTQIDAVRRALSSNSVGNGEQEQQFMMVAKWVNSIAGVNSRVLEIGCGEGSLGFHLQASYAGIDPIQHQDLEEGVDFKVGIGEEIPHPNCSFDFVLVKDAINYFSDLHLLLADASRVLTDGGAILITEFVGARYHPRKQKLKNLIKKYLRIQRNIWDATYLNWYTSDDIVRAAKSSGFNVEYSYPLNELRYYLILRKKFSMARSD